jgi:hypothetical protein
MRALFFGVLLSSFSALVLPAVADTLLTRALAPAADDVQRSWTVQRTGLDYDGKGRLKDKTIAQFDGTQPDGKRWSLLSINGAAPSKSERADFNEKFKANALPPTYALVKSVVTPNAEKLSETAIEAHYRVSTMPAGTTAIKGIDLSKFTIADVTVDKRGAIPFVSQVRVYAPKEFRPVPGGKVTKLERVLRFALGKDGIPVLAEHSMVSDATMLFKAITVRSTATFSHQETVARLSPASLTR